MTLQLRETTPMNSRDVSLAIAEIAVAEAEGHLSARDAETLMHDLSDAWRTHCKAVHIRNAEPRSVAIDLLSSQEAHEVAYAARTLEAIG